MANGNAAELSDLAEDQDTVQPLPAKGRRSSVGSHRSSTDSMHKDDEDAIQPNVAHEWASTENLVPAGPWLQYLGQREGKWLGSALIVLPPTQMNMEEEPVLHYSAGGPESTVQGRSLDEQDGWKFWRFNLSVTMTGEEQAVEYEIDVQDASFRPERYTFYVPAVLQPVHWAFHSCNGLSVNTDLKVWGEPHLWQDVLNRHSEQPMHVVVGGGDQVYNDGFWKMKTFQDWLSISGDKERLQHPFTLEMEQSLSSWVLNHYRMHFTHKLIKQTFACIPQVNQKDDHDIFDGWGSYPDKLQNCPVFQGTFSVLDRFYLLFQQHTTPRNAYAENDMFGPANCYTMLRMMGPNQALLVPDTRGERSRSQIMSAEHYNMMLERCGQLPSSVKHLVVVFTVPIVYPKLPLSQPILTTIEGMPLLKGAMTKTGVGAGIIDKFNHVELLDDIEDHWDSSTHQKERDECIHRFQEHAKLHHHRVSFISGDVHCAQVGRLYTAPKMKHLQHDYRFMPQITSSAIWNNPPPDVLLNLLTKLDHARKTGRHTKEKTVRIFTSGSSKPAKLLGRRNWCEVTEKVADPVGSGKGRAPRLTGMLTFELRAEDPDNMTAVPEKYVVPVPTYVPPRTSADMELDPVQAESSEEEEDGISEAMECLGELIMTSQQENAEEEDAKKECAMSPKQYF